jgi:uncharacterized protein (TIGR00297 family)
MLLLFVTGGTAASARAHRGRGPMQALCNGAVAASGALCALAGARWGGALAAAALATAFSDTVSGEIGRRFGGTPRRLLVGARVAPGADGGMSVLGTAAGALCALALPASGALAGAPWDGRAMVLLAAAGMAGNVADSILGVCVQPHLGARGNDWTNLLATACGGALGAAIA